MALGACVPKSTTSDIDFWIQPLGVYCRGVAVFGSTEGVIVGLVIICCCVQDVRSYSAVFRM